MHSQRANSGMQIGEVDCANVHDGQTSASKGGNGRVTEPGGAAALLLSPTDIGTGKVEERAGCQANHSVCRARP
jgi:hypothetical protein